MSSAVPGGKKALCRYFMSKGTCTYGDECQFLHQNPHAFQQQPQQTIPNSFLNGPPLQNGPTNSADNLGLLRFYKYFLLSKERMKIGSSLLYPCEITWNMYQFTV